MAVTDSTATLDQAGADASVVDVGNQPSTAAVAAAAEAGQQQSSPPPKAGGSGSRRTVAVADAEHAAEMAEKEAELKAALARLAQLEAATKGGLQHATFCKPRPGADEPRIERIQTERIHPRTQQPLGAVDIVRCLECGAQRDEDTNGAA